MNVGETKRDWKGDIYECNILQAFYNGPSENISRTLIDCEWCNFR